MSKIFITRPPSPLPPLPSPARKWKRREDWTAEPAERDPEPSVSETEAFDRFIRRILFWKEVQ